jgi:putative nucleotidyltransferase with HDIG domain
MSAVAIDRAEKGSAETSLESDHHGAGVAVGPNGEERASEFAAAGLEAAIQLRSPDLHACTPMVRELAVRIAEQLGCDPAERGLVGVCARVRDIGMIGLPDDVVLAVGPLSPEQWDLVNSHPVLGAELLERLPGCAAAAEVVRAHHERWDGEGYPDGLRGDSIPLASRVIATADAFVAMASDRPYRRSLGADAALEHVCQQSDAQFDPRVVDALVAALTGTPGRTRPDPGRRAAVRRRPARPARGGRMDLRGALADFDVIAAFGPAHERALSVTASDREGIGTDLVAAIESDTGLTIAVLQRAQQLSTKNQIASVSDAVAALERSEIHETLEALPTAEFPWRTSSEATLHSVRVHALAVVRAVDRLTRELGLDQRDDLITAALLHDIGKLVVARVLPSDVNIADVRADAPEKRIQEEQRALGFDHAALGALLVERWGLPRRLSKAVAAHHTADRGDQIATLVRLADTIAHHAQGDAVDRRVMLRLAASCGLSVPALRDVLFDLPHSGGSQRRRAEPSPLSKRETSVLRGLSEGKLYKQIGADLGLSTSTIRTHLHNVYEKLQVADRAQAVLRATEMGWI